MRTLKALLCATALLFISPALVQAQGGGSINVDINPDAAGDVNLTLEGTADWLLYNYNNSIGNSQTLDTPIRKATGGSQISAFSGTLGPHTSYGGEEGSGGWSQFWTDGDTVPTPMVADAPLPMAFNAPVRWALATGGHAENTLTFTVPASTTPRQLRLRLNGIYAGYFINASLSDGSATSYSSPRITGIEPVRTWTDLVSITYNAAAANQTLTVQIVPDAAGLAIHAVTLNAGKPARPSGVTAAPGDRQAFLKWNAASGAIGYNVYRNGVQIGTTTSLIYFDTASATNSLANGTTYSYTVTSTNFAGESAASTAAAATPQVSAGTGFLSGTPESYATFLNLTAEGTLDWAQWGHNSTFNHKATGGSQISDLTVSGSGVGFLDQDVNFAYTWTDGTPTASATDNSSYSGIGAPNYSEFTVPADTSLHLLRVYVGGFSSAATLTAKLSDGSAVDYTDNSRPTVLYKRGFLVYTLAYRAASAGQTLTVRWKEDTDIGYFGWSTVVGATLAGGHPAVTGNTITGTIALDGVSDLSAANPLVPVGDITFDFFAANSATHTTPLFSQTAPLTPVGGGSPNGTFTLTGVAPAMYDIGIHSSKSLRTVVKNVNATSNVAIPGVITLLGGNANGDNTVNFDDFLVLLNAFGSVVSDPINFDPTADFTYDGVINFDDFLVLLNNFGAVGDN